MIFNFNRIIDIKKSMMDSLICAICSNKTGNSLYTASEKQIGFYDEFLYFKCSACGCLQIAEVPKNLSKYYPENYYSYSIPSQNLFEKLKFVIVKKKLLKYKLYRWSLSGYLFSKRYNYYAWMLRGICNYNSKILDIGCGCGNLLLEMNKLGFKNLKGIDPYIQKDIIYTNGVTVLKKSVEDIDDKYDLIMLHHSFEHMQNSKEVLQKIHGCLNQNCFVLINIPVVSSYAFRKYEVNGLNWMHQGIYFFILLQVFVNLQKIPILNCMQPYTIQFISNLQVAKIISITELYMIMVFPENK